MPDHESNDQLSSDEPIISDKTLDDVITEMFETREMFRAMDREVKKLKAEFADMEKLLIQRLDEAGVAFAGNGIARAAVSDEQVPNITDWDAASEWIHSHKATYLIRRQILATAYRELLNSGEVLPGVETFTKRKISLRKS